ncbi:hypothetical protein [Natrialba sp. SSL1]|uniref:hypothetical protein n=1 Tax=Natrialba sp. SSL1 TaxID=1869245 RepID=UPI0008F7FCAC|nr:hypothetical protein [Natrialba sp. SSL1]OIB57384.1 hypothetical protein BBD46_02575 [Natrialba sp. SSL1]
MEPITLRIQPDLLDDLDDEADEAGFSSRSEYIRHLLLNRSSISQGVTTGIDTATSDTETVDTLAVQVEELTEYVTGLEERITDLEDDVDDDSSSNGPDQKGAGSTNTPTEQEDPSQESTPADGSPGSGQIESTPPVEDLTDPDDEALLALGTWLQEEGPKSEDAQLLMLDAATILDREGPLSASELRERLFDRHPESYKSADTLWASTVERLYEETPGFEKPDYGMYGFDRATAWDVLE